MAQHVLNFTESQFEHDQTPPAGFTVRWVTSGAWDIRHLPGNPAYIGGAGVRWSGSGNARRALSLDVTATGKVHVIVPVRNANSVSGTSLGVLLAGAGSASSETGYAWVLVDGNTFRLNRYSGGSVTNHESTSFAHVAGTHYWIEAEYDPSTDTTRARVWADGSEPPETWQGEFTDGSPLSDGWLGFFTFTAEVRGYSSLFVGTAGDAAPRQPAAPPQPFVTFRGASAIIARAEDDYSHPDASAWTASRFRILDALDAVLETGPEVAKGAGLPDHTFHGLTATTDYQVQVQHKDAEGEWSGWSMATAATTTVEGNVAIAASLIGLSGDPPPDFTKHGLNWTFNGGSGEDDGVQAFGTGGGLGVAQWHVPGTHDDARVLTEARLSGSISRTLRLRLRGDGAHAGYDIRFNAGSNQIILYRDGSEIATESVSVDTARRHFEAEVEEGDGKTHIRARTWPVTDSQPAWQMEEEDSDGGRPTSGWAGIGSTGDFNVHFFAIEVEAEGEPPDSPPPPPLPDPIAPGWKLYRTPWRGPPVAVDEIDTTSARYRVFAGLTPTPAFPTADEWIGSYVDSETWVHDAEATERATYVVDTIAADGSLTRLRQWTGVKGAANGLASFEVEAGAAVVPVGVFHPEDPVAGLQRLDVHRGESQTFTATEGNRIAAFPPHIERMAVNTVAGAWYRVVYQTPDEPLVSPAFQLEP